MKARLLLPICGALAASMACTQAESPAPQDEQQAAAVGPCEGLDTLSEAEEAEGWRLLFDGETMDGWHGYNGQDPSAWTIEDCALKSVGTEGNYGSDTRADLTTDDQFTDFELVLDWKATTGGNSGVMYGVIEDPKYDAAWKTGPEYQFIDEVGFPEDLEDWQEAGANYAMHVADPELKRLNPVGEWNTTKIVVNGNHVEHWLNGNKILEFERWNDDWEKLKNSGKWSEAPDYGMAKTGHLVLQDHGSVFWFRNIKIRELGDDSDEAETGEEAGY